MEIIAASVIISIGIIIQAYFNYKLLKTIAILKASPDVRVLRQIGKAIDPQPQETPLPGVKGEKTIDPSSWDQKVIDEVREIL